jgi:hypothetical protein
MKRLVCSCLWLAIVNLCVAQDPLPEFGEITAAEQNISECSFDKEADAVVLFDEASADNNDQHNLIVNRRIRLKILKPKGNRHGDISIRYYHKDDNEYVNGIEAYTCNYRNNLPDIKKVPASAIYRQKVNDRISVVRIPMPDVQTGSIIEYKYTTTKKYYSWLDDWYFQGELPVIHSRFSLVVMPNYEFAYRVRKSDLLPVVIKQEKNSGRIYFGMDSIAGLRDEPYMDAEKDYLQHVEFQLSGYQGTFGGTTKTRTTWDELNRELAFHEKFGVQLNKNIPVGTDWQNKIKAMSSPYEKMSSIYNFVFRNFTWSGVGGIGAENGVKDTWEKRKGNSSDINLMLVNLLMEAGLEAYPLLVSTRGNGKVNPDIPFLDQFDKVMAYVVIGDKKYVLDAAGPYTPPFMIPFSVINTNAFVVQRKKGRIISLTETEKQDRNLVNIIAAIDENGNMKGEAYIQSYDYARLNRLRAYERDRDRFKEDYYTSYQPDLTIDSLLVKNIDNDSLPFAQRFVFFIPPTASGDYKLINLNLFSGITKNPFISDIRFTNIDYGCLQSYTVTEAITLPPSMKLENMPKNIRLIMPDTSIALSRYVQVENNILSVKYSIKTARSVFTADEYEYVRSFYKKMAEIMNEQIVLKKN